MCHYYIMKSPRMLPSDNKKEAITAGENLTAIIASVNRYLRICWVYGN